MTKTIASVESLTGGGFGYQITKTPGASKFYKGTLVTYANEIKEKLGVDTSQGVVNAEVAQQMALKGKEFFNVDYCISFTGNAGPSVLDNKEVGLVYIAINEQVYELLFKGDRQQIREQAINFAIDKIKKIIF